MNSEVKDRKNRKSQQLITNDSDFLTLRVKGNPVEPIFNLYPYFIKINIILISL